MYSASKEPTAKNLKNDFEDTGTRAKQDLSEIAHDAGAKVRKLFDSASHEINHATDVVTTQVRNKPLQSSLMALAAGFVLGTIFRR